MTLVDLNGIIIHAISTINQGSVSVALRPEDITLYTHPDGKMSARNVLTGLIADIKPYGIISHVIVACGRLSLAVQVTWQSVRELNLDTGKEVIISFKASSVHVMPHEQESCCET
jgi:molybdopterin-binding protein